MMFLIVDATASACAADRKFVFELCVGLGGPGDAGQRARTSAAPADAVWVFSALDRARHAALNIFQRSNRKSVGWEPSVGQNQFFASLTDPAGNDIGFRRADSVVYLFGLVVISSAHMLIYARIYVYICDDVRGPRQERFRCLVLF